MESLRAPFLEDSSLARIMFYLQPLPRVGIVLNRLPISQQTQARYVLIATNQCPKNKLSRSSLKKTLAAVRKQLNLLKVKMQIKPVPGVEKGFAEGKHQITT